MGRGGQLVISPDSRSNRTKRRSISAGDSKTRENRITAIGNDLYSTNSKSFLNPFLGILRCALFPPSRREYREPRPPSPLLSPLLLLPSRPSSLIDCISPTSLF